MKAGETVEHPDWCRLLHDDCWSVLYGHVKDENYCKKCEFHKNNNPVNIIFSSED